MTKRLIIVRHGNTFLPEQTPTRVGRKTDLPLVEEVRGRTIGKYLLSKNIKLDKVYAAPLKRTMQTAKLALEELNSNLPIIPSENFSEIDYGPDENKTEQEVLIRLGKDYTSTHNIEVSYENQWEEYGKTVLQAWDKEAIVPYGWSVDVETIIKAWQDLASSIQDGETVLICSSNGIIRFAPHILNLSYDKFCEQYDIKVATGSVSIFDYIDGEWTCSEWNTKPYKLF